MNIHTASFDPPDYADHGSSSPIPMQRVIAKLEEYMGKRDYDGARRHLLYWKEEAAQMHDFRGMLSLCNELIGHYRKTADREAAFSAAEEALKLLKHLDLTSSLTAGTTYINIATALSAFGEYSRALTYYEEARLIYEECKDTPLSMLGGLYNNYGIALTAAGQYEEARGLFEKAFEQMGQAPEGVLEQAITLLNMADLIAARDGMVDGEAEICRLLDQALELLRAPQTVRNGYYAFVCEKCAPVFEYYGYFSDAQELQQTAEQIYEDGRNKTL